MDEELQELLKQFVCVRVVQMWGLDLDRYQFDGFLSWAVFFSSADGTIYGRYGTRSVSGNLAGETKMTLEGFKKTLRATLRLHESYLDDPETIGKTLAGKVGPKRPWKLARDIPAMTTMFPTAVTPFKGGGTHGKCMHCHMVPRAEAVSLDRMKKPLPENVFWPYPLPREIGMEMDPKEVASILKIRKDSPAAKAGLREGDRIKQMTGQPILSSADIQWILHHAGNPDTLVLDVERNGEPKQIELRLARGWRTQMQNWSYLHNLLTGDLMNTLLFEAEPEEREQHKLQEDALALIVRRPEYWPNGRATVFMEGDVIVEVDGKRDAMSVWAFAAYVYEQESPRRLHVTVIRDGKEKKFEVIIP